MSSESWTLSVHDLRSFVCRPPPSTGPCCVGWAADLFHQTYVGACRLSRLTQPSAQNVDPAREPIIHSYLAYNLVIHSDLPLPELTASPAAQPDAVIRLKEAGPECACPCAIRQCHHVQDDTVRLFWDGVGTYEVCGGKEIRIAALPGADPDRIRLILHGIVTAVLLHQRGLLVLHASAAEVNGAAVAFLGTKGSGKSTLAAALYARGHRLLADDVVAVDTHCSGELVVLPGYPQFKLWPQAAIASLGDDPDCLPQLTRALEKRARRVHDRFASRPMPLGRVYVLGEGPTPEVQPIEPRAALLQLLCHTYCSRFGNDLLQGPRAAAHLLQCSAVVRSVPFRWLRRPRNLEGLSILARRVEADLAAGTSTKPPPVCTPTSFGP